MITLPREPWRGGQICGEQLSVTTWTSRASYCGEFKKPGSPLCEEHDRELREDNYGALPKFADGNALGLEITFCSQAWLLRDADGELVAGSNSLDALRFMHGFTLKWEPYEGDKPVEPTPEELAAYEAQLEASWRCE